MNILLWPIAFCFVLYFVTCCYVVLVFIYKFKKDRQRENSQPNLGGLTRNMSLKRLQRVYFVGAFLMLLWSIPSWGQSPARIDGVIQDQTNAAVQGAKLQIVNVQTGVATEASSNASGQYVVPFVLPGTYTLTVSKTGFKEWGTTIVLHANDHTAVNVTLAVASAKTESIQVTASVGDVETDSGQRSETITSQQIQDFSTTGPDAEELMTLLPGVTANGSGAYNSHFNAGIVSSDNNGIEGFNVNGNRSDANTFKLDGGNMDDMTGNNGSNIYPNTEFISELSVETSNFTADQGGSPVLITAVTKSGSKDLHGEAFWLGRNYAFDANDWSNNAAGEKRAQEKYNYPGFEVGGPIVLPGMKYNRGDAKKLFFFVGMQWNRQLPDPGTELADVPTQKMLTGDFSDIVLSSACQGGGSTYLHQPCSMVDPATGKNLSQQDGKLSTYSQNTVGLLKSLLGPNQIGPNYTDPNGNWNEAGHPMYPQNVTQYVGRFDWDPSDLAHIFVRVGKQDETVYSPFGEYAGENSTWTSNVPDPTPAVMEYHSKSLNVNMVSIISASLTNEFTFNTNALDQPNHYKDPSVLEKSTLGVNFNGVFGTNPYPIVPQIVPAWGFCNSFNQSGCSDAPGEGRWGPSNLVGAGNFYKQTQFEFGDNLTKVVGAHIFKFGGIIGRARNDQNSSGQPLEGALVPSTWTAGTSGDEYADILTDHFVSYSQTNHDVRGNLRSSSFEWFGQDSWKIKSNLTLEYGARWTLQGPWYEAQGLGTTFDPRAYDSANSSSVYDGIRTASCTNPGQSNVPLCGTVPKTIRSTGGAEVQPRLGFSWNARSNGKTVLRGGFGVYTQRDPTNAGFQSVLGPPNLFESTINQGSTYLTLESIQSSNPGTQGAFTYGQSNAVTDPHDNKVPHTYQYNLTITQTLPSHLTAELAYVGSQSRHQQIEQNIDSVPYGALWLPGTHTVNPALAGNEQLAAPYNPFAQIVQIQHGGNANYNGLQGTLRRQASRSLDFITSYTYSKAMGDSDEFQSLLADPFSTKDSRHVLAFDRTHVFSIGYQYRLPNLSGAIGKSAVARGVANGWMLSGMTKASSGGPIAINAQINCFQLQPNGQAVNCNSSGSGNTSNWNQTDSWFGTNAWGKAFLPGSQSNPANGVYPVYTCNPRKSHGNINTAFINTSCVTLPSFGDQGAIDPPYVKSPGSLNFDLAGQKSFRLGEGRHLDVRASSFDLVNRGQPNSLNTTAIFNWNIPVGATDPAQGTPVLTNGTGTGTCASSVIPLGYSCGKVGHRQLEGSLKLFF